MRGRFERLNVVFLMCLSCMSASCFTKLNCSLMSDVLYSEAAKQKREAKKYVDDDF